MLNGKTLATGNDERLAVNRRFFLRQPFTVHRSLLFTFTIYLFSFILAKVCLRFSGLIIRKLWRQMWKDCNNYKLLIKIFGGFERVWIKKLLRSLLLKKRFYNRFWWKRDSCVIKLKTSIAFRIKFPKKIIWTLAKSARSGWVFQARSVKFSKNPSRPFPSNKIYKASRSVVVGFCNESKKFSARFMQAF